MSALRPRLWSGAGCSRGSSSLARTGFSILEGLVATVVLTMAALSLLGLFQGGVRRAEAGADEVVAGHLLAELGEEMAAAPAATLAEACAGEGLTLDSDAGTLEDGARLGAGWELRLSPLPVGYRRELRLRRGAPDLVQVEATVRWRTAGNRRPSLVARRLVVLPSEGGRSQAW